MTFRGEKTGGRSCAGEGKKNMRLDLADAAQCERYDHFVSSSPMTSFLQFRAWAKVKHRWQAACFYRERDGVIRAAAQVLSIPDITVGRPFFYVPHGPVCDWEEQEEGRLLFEEICEYARSRGAFLLRAEPRVIRDAAGLNQKRLEALIGPLHSDPDSFSQAPMSTILCFDGRSEDEIFAGYSKNMRRLIRAAYRRGLCLYVGERRDLPLFYRMLTEMCVRKGIGCRPYEYFERMYDAFPDRLRLTFAGIRKTAPANRGEAEAATQAALPPAAELASKDELDLLACSLMLCEGRAAYSLYGADPLYQNLGQSYFLDFEEIRYAAAEGFACYDMGGVYEDCPENGLCAFKKRMTQGGLVHWVGVRDVVFDPEVYARYRREVCAHPCCGAAGEESETTEDRRFAKKV